MGYSAVARNAASDAMAALGTWLALHTADPDPAGDAEVSGGSYGRVSTTWSPANDGNATGTQVTFDVPGGVTITHWSYWDAQTGGTYLGGGALAAPATYSQAGTYNFTATLVSRNAS